MTKMPVKKWFRFNPEHNWREMEPKERGMALAILKMISPPIMEQFLTDDEILDAYFVLIEAGLIDVMIRRVKGGIEAKMEFPLGTDIEVAVGALGLGSVH